MILQIVAVIGINILNIPRRMWAAISTVVAVVVVVFVLLIFLAMANGFHAALDRTGSDSIAILMRSGAQAEVNSVVSRQQSGILSGAPGIAQTENGITLASSEVYTIVDGSRQGENSKVNIPFRGLSRSGVALRKNFSLVSGRMFEAGQNELIVGLGAKRAYSGLAIGQKILFGSSEWHIVGIFTAAGSVYESELWADARSLQNGFQHNDRFQSVRVQLKSADQIDELMQFVENDPRLNVTVKSEKEYFLEQGNAIRGLVYFGWGITIIMSFGALAAAMGAMYINVADRIRELTTLRAIGFSRTSVFIGTSVESLLFAVCGGILGFILAFVVLPQIETTTFGASLTQVAFKFELNINHAIDAVLFSLIIGIVGGVFPAWHAVRTPIRIAFS